MKDKEARNAKDGLEREGGHWEGRCWISDKPKVHVVPQSNSNFSANNYIWMGRHGKHKARE